MWLTLLDLAIPFFTAGGGGALAWYMRGAMGKVTDPKPTPKVPTLAEAVKGGYEAVEKMAKDIHRMYHPDGCKCAMCEIKGDDVDDVDADGSVKYCANPCFGCTMLTCVTHPDNKPVKKPEPKKPWVFMNDTPKYTINGYFCTGEEADDFRRTGQLPPWHPGDNAAHRPRKERLEIYRTTHLKPPKGVDVQEDTDAYNRRDVDHFRKALLQSRTHVKNLEDQVTQLGEACSKLTEERDKLKEERGLQSAGMYVAGKPLYMLVKDRPVAMDHPASGPGSMPPFEFEPDPKKTDRQNMQELARAIAEDEDLMQKLMQERLFRQAVHK